MAINIRYIDDQNGNHIFPVTIEQAVLDLEGVPLETKLGQKQETLVSGINIRTVKGTSLLGSGNIDVQDGKSAYQLWLDAGNAGTEADFLASLQGDTGSSIDYPFTVVNNLTAGGTTSALSAEQGKLLKNITDMLYSRPVVLSESAYEALETKDTTKIYMTYEDE